MVKWKLHVRWEIGCPCPVPALYRFSNTQGFDIKKDWRADSGPVFFLVSFPSARHEVWKENIRK